MIDRHSTNPEDRTPAFSGRGGAAAGWDTADVFAGPRSGPPYTYAAQLPEWRRGRDKILTKSSFPLFLYITISKTCTVSMTTLPAITTLAGPLPYNGLTPGATLVKGPH